MNQLQATRERSDLQEFLIIAKSIHHGTRDGKLDSPPEIKADQESCKNMNVNFFEWIREGVRKSVLLGVSDAIEQIGAPNDADQVNPTLTAMLQEAPKHKKSRASSGRKRLGKSLKDMEAIPTETK